MGIEQRHFEELSGERALHEKFNEMRNDPHVMLEDVQWEDLSPVDIQLFKRFLDGTLTQADIDARQEELGNNDQQGGEDPSADFVAMLANKFIARGYYESHKEGNA